MGVIYIQARWLRRWCDCSSLGNCVFTKRAVDAQTTDSTMTSEDEGSGANTRALTLRSLTCGSHIDHSGEQDVFISPLSLVFVSIINAVFASRDNFSLFFSSFFVRGEGSTCNIFSGRFFVNLCNFF